LLAILLDAVALKVAVLAPAAIVTDAGTVSKALLLASVTVDPPVGAALLRVTVHVLTPLGPRLVGLQVTPDSAPAASRLRTAVCVLPPNVAVTVAL
jgi:hypothetical protein